VRQCYLICFTAYCVFQTRERIACTGVLVTCIKRALMRLVLSRGTVHARGGSGASLLCALLSRS
jgi:hypothetical protein